MLSDVKHHLLLLQSMWRIIPQSGNFCLRINYISEAQTTFECHCSWRRLVDVTFDDSVREVRKRYSIIFIIIDVFKVA